MEEITTPVWQFISTYWLEIIIFAWLFLLTATLQMNVNMWSSSFGTQSKLLEYQKEDLERQINWLRNNDIKSLEWRIKRLERRLGIDTDET